MSNHRWRQGHNIDPLREWGRRDLPGAADGFVWVDLDGAIRRYGQGFGLDADGDLMLYEKKEMTGTLTRGALKVYSFIDDGLRTGDRAPRYRGSYLLRVVYTEPIPVCECCGQPRMTADQAYALFQSARLYWNNDPITHDGLRRILLGNVPSRAPEPAYFGGQR